MRNLRQLRGARGSTIGINRLRDMSYLRYCIVINLKTAGGMRKWWKHRYYFNKYYWI